MKFAITAIGTRGDLQPYVALAVGLKQAGHEVILISSRDQEKFVSGFGLPFFALDVNIRRMMEQGEMKSMRNGNNPFRFIVGHLRGASTVKNLMIKSFISIWKVTKDVDCLIWHPGLSISFYLARQSQQASIMATPFPIVQTKDYPAILFYNGPRLGKIYNHITHWILQQLLWSLSKSAVREFWKKEIQSNISFNINPIRRQIHEGSLVLNGYSELLFHASKDWTSSIQTTGSWMLDEEPAWAPSDSLLEFIRNGSLPVYIGFGSMNDGRSFNSMLSLIADALAQSNQRAVVALGWNHLTDGNVIPDSIFLVDSIPHSWLFPRVAAVVHHGGAGTTAAGLQAGKPAVIIPSNADQPAWGKRLQELGVGVKPIQRSQLSATLLAAAITQSLSPEVVATARILGEKLRMEKGVENAVRAVETFMQSRKNQFRGLQ